MNGRSRPRRLSIAALFALAVIARPAGEVVAADSPVVARILARWQERQERVKSLHLTRRETLSVGRSVDPSLPFDDYDHAGLSADRSVAGPTKELWLEGLRFRAELSNDNLTSLVNFPNNQRPDLYLSTARPASRFIGALTLPADALSRGGPLALEKSLASGEYQPLQITELVPAELAFGLLAETSGRWELVTTNAVVGKGHFVKLIRRSSIGRNNALASRFPSVVAFEAVWVDPQRDDVVVHWEERIGNGTSRLASIDYQAHPQLGWAPSGWVVQVGVSRMRSLAAQAAVTGLEINSRIPADTFELHPPTLKRIFVNWNRRREQATSFHFQWKGRITAPNARLHQIMLPFDDYNRTVIYGNPSDVDSPWEFWLEPDRYRAEFPNLKARTKSDRRVKRAGVVSEGTPLQIAEVAPLMLHYRTRDLGFGEWRVVLDNAVVGAGHFIKLEKVSRSSGRGSGQPAIQTFWVDPQRDDVIVHWEEQLPTRQNSAISIEYESDPAFGWVPRSWTIQQILEGNTSRATQATVTSRSFNEASK